MEPFPQTLIKPPSALISTFNPGLHTHHAPNNTVANSSDASLVQVFHSSTQGSHWSNKRTYQEDSTPLLEASTTGIMTTVLTNMNANQKPEISSWSLSITNNHSLITTLKISTTSDGAYAASSDNSIAHFTHTAISKKKDTLVQLITLLPSTQVALSLLVTFKTKSSNPVTASSVSASFVRSSSPIELTFNSTHEVATKTSIAPQDSFTEGGNSNLLSPIEGSATTVANPIRITLATKTVAITALSSPSSSLSSTTTLSHTSDVLDRSSLQMTSQSDTGRSLFDSQDRQTGNIPIHKSSSIIFGRTVSLKSASLISMISHSLKSVLSQSTSQGSNTLVSKQEDRSSSAMHATVATTDGSGSGSETRTATHNFINGMSLQATITHGNMAKTILPSFHTKGSKESFFVTPMVGQSSTFPSPSGGNGSFDASALPSFTKGSESLETYPRAVTFSMSVTISTPNVQLNTSYNLSAASKTHNLVQTLNLPTRISLPTSHDNTTISLALSITSLPHTINSSGVRSGIRPTTSAVARLTTIGSSLPPAFFKPTISYSVTKRSLISMMYQATDVLSPSSTAGSGSQFQPPTLVQASSSTPFTVRHPGVSETSALVLTTQKPSKSVSVNLHDTSSTHSSIKTVPSHSKDRNLSFAAELSSTSDTKQQRTSSMLVFVTSSQAIKATELPFGSVSTNSPPGNSIWTSFSTTKETLNSIQTQSSPSQETPPFSSRITSSISLDTTKTIGTAATAHEATVSLSTQTGPPPVSPKQFDVSMVLQMTWKSHYEYPYTPEFQALASKIKTEVTTVLITLDGFLSLNVLRFWKGSVGVDVVVFVTKSAEVREDILERTLIDANNSGVLDLPLTNIQVQERGTTTTTILATTLSTKEDKSIERWIIILIAAGILVFFMSLIICSMLVSKL